MQFGWVYEKKENKNITFSKNMCIYTLQSLLPCEFMIIIWKLKVKSRSEMNTWRCALLTVSTYFKQQTLAGIGKLLHFLLLIHLFTLGNEIRLHVWYGTLLKALMLKRPILAAEAKANHVARRGKLNQSYRYMSD